MPQLSAAEQDFVRSWAQKKTPVEVHKLLVQRRRKAGQVAPDLTNVRRFLKGETHKVGQEETRGAKRTYTRRAVLAMEKARLRLIKKADGEEEVTWPKIQKNARVKQADPTTVARSFKREGLQVERHTPREKPLRTPEHEAERKEYCRTRRKVKKDHYLKKVDMYIDNKHWKVPATARSRRYLRMRKVRFHLRKRSEGLKPGFTKPGGKRHAMNTGGMLSLVAGISNCKVVLWHYMDGRWDGEVAAKVYRGPLYKALRRAKGNKAKYNILEDNDPSGYKSNKALAAKEELKIKSDPFPRYSPDLNPLDYFLWTEVEARMEANAPKKLETKDKFKLRLRKTAMSIPKSVIRKGLLSLNGRIRSCYDNDGGHIPFD